MLYRTLASKNSSMQSILPIRSRIRKIPTTHDIQRLGNVEAF